MFSFRTRILKSAHKVKSESPLDALFGFVMVLLGYVGPERHFRVIVKSVFRSKSLAVCVKMLFLCPVYARIALNETHKFEQTKISH